MTKKTSILLTDDDRERINKHFAVETSKRRVGAPLTMHGFLRWLMRLGLDALDETHQRRRA